MTPSLSLPPLSRVVRPSPGFPELQVLWEHPARRESEEPTVREARGEAEESRECLARLELLEGKDCLAGPEILESLASQAGR